MDCQQKGRRIQTNNELSTMAHVFGISNHSPDQVLSFLARREAIADMSDVAIVPASTKLRVGAKPLRNSLFIIALPDLYSNFTVLNCQIYRDTKIFVFASALKLRAISGITPLDYMDNPDGSSVSFLSLSGLNYSAFSRALRRPGPDLHRAPVDYLYLLSSGVKTGSLLNPLMTFIYSLPSQAQTTVKEGVANYIALGTITASALFSRLGRSLAVPLTPKQVLRLRNILETDLCKVFVSSFTQMRGHWESKEESFLHQLCKNNSISAYEMRYLRSISSLVARDKKSSRELVNGN